MTSAHVERCRACKGTGFVEPSTNDAIRARDASIRADERRKVLAEAARAQCFACQHEQPGYVHHGQRECVYIADEGGWSHRWLEDGIVWGPCSAERIRSLAGGPA